MATFTLGRASRQPYTFVDPLPVELKCHKCYRVASDPQQLSCCGKLLCKVHLPRLQPSECPYCDKQYATYPDQASDRRIKDLKVNCNIDPIICKWSGELRDFEEHRSTCEVTTVRCMRSKCRATFPRYKLEEHNDSECPFRLHHCPRCSKKDTYEAIQSTHEAECPMVEILCPNNGCEFHDKRAVVAFHRATCPKETVVCEYSKIGCNAMVTRETIAEHLAGNVVHHLKLAMDTIAAQRSLAIVPPRVFKMSGYQSYKVTGKTWESPAFYTHQGGYKMTITVEVSQWNKSISVYLYLVAGENDHKLVWPFRGEVTVMLLNQANCRGHHTQVINFNASETKDHNKRPHKRKKNGGWGISEFASLAIVQKAKTNTCYLQDDCLYFKICRVTIHDDNKPWLTPTT